MIKAVFFDWSYTLAYGEPGREEIYDRVLKELGFEIAPKVLMRGIFAADSLILKGDFLSRLTGGSDAEKAQIGAYYPRLIFKEANLEASDETVLKVLRAVMRYYWPPCYRLYDDALPTLKVLKVRGLKLGLVTNASKEQLATLRDTGLETCLDLVANAEEAGADKPKPPVFRLALKKAGVSASEAVHVGDQYELDILGARGVGIAPVLIDRYDLYPESEFRPRIRSLTELPDYL
ncbi:MAG: HAD family hydrolase [Chloroflexota bacterium]